MSINNNIAVKCWHTHAFSEYVFGLEVFASVKSVMDGCGHLEGLGLCMDDLVKEAKRGAVVPGSPVEELLS